MRWRLEQPKEGDPAILKAKEVVVEFTKGVTSNIVLMGSQDFVLILEGQISLVDASDLKIQKSAREDIVYFPLSQRFWKH